MDGWTSSLGWFGASLALKNHPVGFFTLTPHSRRLFAHVHTHTYRTKIVNIGYYGKPTVHWYVYMVAILRWYRDDCTAKMSEHSAPKQGSN